MSQSIAVSDLRDLAREFVSSHASGARNFWREPLLVTARADDRFAMLCRMAADDHLLPKDLLPSARTVIIFFIPFVPALLDENTPGKFPCRNWGLAYEATNRLIGDLSERIKEFLADRGFSAALTPATHNFDEQRLMARWSHKHLAHLSGLGRLGVNCQLITPAGCAGRLGSLVTEADLGDHPLTGKEELCLHKVGKECLQCVRRCPVAALTPEAFDRRRCWERLKLNLERSDALAGLDSSTHVCGKCVVGLPCSVDPILPCQRQ